MASEDAIEDIDEKTGDHLDRGLGRRRIGSVRVLLTTEYAVDLYNDRRSASVDEPGGHQHEVRCRLVARECNIKGAGMRDDFFAAMLPARGIQNGCIHFVNEEW